MTHNKTRKTKSRSKNVGEPVVMISSDSPFRPDGDVVVDIEREPFSGGHDPAMFNDPQCSRIIAIGYYEPSKKLHSIHVADEAAMLRQFWDAFLGVNGFTAKIFGFNVLGFTLPFLVRRSWSCSVRVPDIVYRSGRQYWSKTFIDLLNEWKCVGLDQIISLDDLARTLSVSTPPDDSEHFYNILERSQTEAVYSLRDHITVVASCANEMGLLSV